MRSQCALCSRDIGLCLSPGRATTPNQHLRIHTTDTEHTHAMPRGRKRDPTLPPSRSLLTQRAFRERKAQYVSDLEQRCKVAEAENERLKIELEELRTRLQTLESARREGSKDGAGGILEQSLESRLRDDMVRQARLK